MTRASNTRAIYQSPIVVPLGELAAGSGSCQVGTTVNTGSCTTGAQNSTGTCGNGNNNYYGGTCQNGNVVNTRRQCSGGSVPT